MRCQTQLSFQEHGRARRMNKHHVGEGRASKVKFLRWFYPPAPAPHALSRLTAGGDRLKHGVPAVRSHGPPSWTTAAFHVASSLSPEKERGAFFCPGAAPETLLSICTPILGARLGEGLCSHPALCLPFSRSAEVRERVPCIPGGQPAS